MSSAPPGLSVGSKVRVNTYRLRGWLTGRVVEVDKNHASVQIDGKLDPFGHPTFFAYTDMEMV